MNSHKEEDFKESKAKQKEGKILKCPRVVVAVLVYRKRIKHEFIHTLNNNNKGMLVQVLVILTWA
jgi:hypothetical protein